MTGKSLLSALVTVLAVSLLPSVAASAGTASASGSAITSAAPAAAVESVSAERAKKGKKKGWKPQTVALFNNPIGNDEARFRLQAYLLKAIRNTRKGQYIRISVYSFDRPEVASALVAAHKRGVHVQILMNDHQTTRAQRTLYRALGRKRYKQSFAYQCKDSCRASRDNLHSKFYLFSKTGGVKDVVMLGSVNFTLNAVKHQWNDLLSLPNRPEIYDDLVETFKDMRHDYKTDQKFKVYCSGDSVKNTKKKRCASATDRWFLRVFPRKATPQNDAVLSIIKPIQCTYREGGALKRTQVTLSMHTMRGPRGDYLAERVRRLWADGCAVRVIYGLMGAKTKYKIGAPTARGRIPLRSAGFDTNADGDVDRYTHQKYFTVRGMYGGKVQAMSWTGSSNWSSRGTSGDEVIFNWRGTGIWRQYQKNFNFMWSSNRNTRNSYTTTASPIPVVTTRTLPDGQLVKETRMVPGTTTTVRPDGLGDGSKTWEDD